MVRALAWARPPLPRSRLLAGWLIGAGAITILTWILALNRNNLSVASSLILYLPVVVITTAVGGPLPGLGTAIASPGVANWFLVPPYHTFRVGDWENIVELSVFVFVASSVSLFASRAARREVEAFQARSNALALSRLFERTGSDELDYLLGVLCDTFELNAANIRHRHDGMIRSFTRKRTENQGPLDCIPIDDESELEIDGLPSNTRGSLLFSAFVSELSRCMERQRLRERALEAEALTRVDELRSALLRAVSHDLRTPLAGIKAVVSGLLQEDVIWDPVERRELLMLVEAETDRLTSIVSNLLDLSRIEAGVVVPRREMCSVYEIILEVLADPRFGDRVRVECEPSVLVHTDPFLLIRIIANLLENAVKWSPMDRMVTVKSETSPGGVRVSVVDQGPGIPDDQKDLVRKPFHRIDDSRHVEGLGLGLAIVDRLVDILGGAFELESTPAGGLTTVVSLPGPNMDER